MRWNLFLGQAQGKTVPATTRLWNKVFSYCLYNKILVLLKDKTFILPMLQGQFVTLNNILSKPTFTSKSNTKFHEHVHSPGRSRSSRWYNVPKPRGWQMLPWPAAASPGPAVQWLLPDGWMAPAGRISENWWSTAPLGLPGTTFREPQAAGPWTRRSGGDVQSLHFSYSKT